MSATRKNPTSISGAATDQIRPRAQRAPHTREFLPRERNSCAGLSLSPPRRGRKPGRSIRSIDPRYARWRPPQTTSFPLHGNWFYNFLNRPTTKVIEPFYPRSVSSFRRSHSHGHRPRCNQPIEITFPDWHWMNPPSNLSPSIRSYLFVYYIERLRRLSFQRCLSNRFSIEKPLIQLLFHPFFSSTPSRFVPILSFPSLFLFFLFFRSRETNAQVGRRQVHIGRRITLRSSFFHLSSSR